jgi:hypothetical protein
VAGQVAALTSTDSKLNQMAKTEGLKAANRRGLLNSSMAVGASQDALLKNVLPIAQQDASQAFQKNMAARGFEYGMTGQKDTQAFTTSERIGTQGWQTAESIAQRGFLGTQADLDRDLQLTMQDNQITSAEGMLIKQIASTEGIEAANRKLQETLLNKDIAFRMSEGKLDRASAEKMQALDIAAEKVIATLSRDLQDSIARMNLKSTDRAAAAQVMTNLEAQYIAAVDSINSNTSMSAAARTTALTAAKNLRSAKLNLVEQMFGIDLKW